MGKVNNNVPLEYSTEENNLKIFGFWTFLGAEIMLFGTLFASYFLFRVVQVMVQLLLRFSKLVQY